MHIDIAPETERLVREEISSGHFGSVDQLIKAGVEALREKNRPPAKPRTTVLCGAEICTSSSPSGNWLTRFSRLKHSGRSGEAEDVGRFIAIRDGQRTSSWLAHREQPASHRRCPYSFVHAAPRV